MLAANKRYKDVAMILTKKGTTNLDLVDAVSVHIILTTQDKV